jgi:hypothetical protein
MYQIGKLIFQDCVTIILAKFCEFEVCICKIIWFWFQIAKLIFHETQLLGLWFKNVMWLYVPHTRQYTYFGGPWNGKCWYVYRHLKYLTAIWYILCPFGISCVHLVYFVVNWYILWSFGIFCCHLVNFFRFSMLYPEKSGNPVKSAKVLGEYKYDFSLHRTCQSFRYNYLRVLFLLKATICERWHCPGIVFRVTRMGEISPIVWLFTFGRFFWNYRSSLKKVGYFLPP